MSVLWRTCVPIDGSQGEGVRCAHKVLLHFAQIICFVRKDLCIFFGIIFRNVDVIGRADVRDGDLTEVWINTRPSIFATHQLAEEVPVLFRVYVAELTFELMSVGNILDMLLAGWVVVLAGTNESCYARQ